MSSTEPREISSRGTHGVALQLLQEAAGIVKVLDIPCGQGAMAQRLLACGYRVSLGDLVDNVRLPGTEFAATDMNQPLPFAAGSLDAIMCVDGIEHIERPYDFAKECFRVIRPGGVLVLSTPNISSLRSRWRWFWTGFHHQRKAPLDETNPNPLHHINMLEVHKLRYMLHREGFRITDIRTNRCKAVAYLYAPLVPLAWLMTKLVFKKEIKRPAVQAIAGDVMAQLFSHPVLFGDELVVKAVRPATPANGSTA